jgi:hypothetical protein
MTNPVASPEIIANVQQGAAENHYESTIPCSSFSISSSRSFFSNVAAA